MFVEKGIFGNYIADKCNEAFQNASHVAEIAALRICVIVAAAFGVYGFSHIKLMF